MVVMSFAELRTGDVSRSGRRTSDRFQSGDGLALVLTEIAELMQASGAMLTMHSDDAYEPVIIHADAAIAGTARESQLLAVAQTVRADPVDGQAFWRNGIGGSEAAVLLIPIERVPGHSRLMISILFEQPTDQLRQRAEELHHDRRPFAVGFFQLWQINRKLRKRVEALRAVLDQTDIGVVLLDRAGHVVYTNRTSEEMLAKGDAIRLAGPGLRAANLSDTVNLQAALNYAISADRRQKSKLLHAPLMRLRREGGSALIASVLPAPSSPDEPSDAAVIMYIVDPKLDTANVLAPFCRLHGLSPVETTLACHIAAGEPIAAAAQKMHIKVQTARSYLKQIFLKTATKRQAELVAMIFSSLIRMNVGVLQDALPHAAGDRMRGHAT